MKSQRTALTTLVLALLSVQAVNAQNISEIAQSDPLIITGSVGTQNTYHYSSSGNGYGAPLSNTVYANLNISLYGISMPFSLYYSNDNFGFSYPHISFDLSPSYKSWTGHFGRSSMDFSQYVLNMSWNGVGLEYNNSRLRFGAFYGKFRNAVNDDPSDPGARKPQYSRLGWGVKVGYGSSTNYIDLYLLSAFDRIGSLDEVWLHTISPQNNLAVAVKGCVTPFKWMSFTVNAAASAFNTDSNADKIEVEEARKWENIFDVRYSSLLRFAGDASLNLSLPLGVNASIFYKMVQPDYTSLGTYYMSNNYQSIGVTASTTLFKRVSLAGTYSGQNDNLTKKQMYTTSGYVYSVYASSRIETHFNIMASYNGYTQRQSDGTCVVNDSTRVSRQMSSYSLTPAYMLDGTALGHTISLSVNYTQNLDLNKFTEELSHGNVNTCAIGVNYGLSVKPWEMDFGISFSHQQSIGYRSRYTSDVGTVSASRSFLKEKNLSLGASLNLCYNEIYRQSKSLSLGGDISAGYTIKKVHSLSASASFNRFGDANMSKIHSELDCLDICCSLNYVYTFSLLEIKKKNHKAAADVVDE